MSSQSEIAIEIKNVNKTYTLHNRGFTIRERVFSLFKKSNTQKLNALKNINFSIKKGEFFGIIGHNGCGKSTLISIMNKAIPSDDGGVVNINGTVMRLALGMGFDPQLTAIQNIMINGSVLGLTIKELKQKTDEILDFAELQSFKDSPVKYYSTGMKSRLMFAIAIYANADIFLMDEFFGGVGDKNFKAKAQKVFEDRILNGRTIIHVSHSMETIRKYCDRVLLLKNGEIVAIGKPEDVIPLL